MVRYVLERGWQSAWKTGQSDRVKVISGIKFNWQPVTSGTPLGTILGPTLFNTCINDWVESISSLGATDMTLGCGEQYLCSEGPAQAGGKELSRICETQQGWRWTQAPSYGVAPCSSTRQGLACPFWQAVIRQFFFKSSLRAYHYLPFQGAHIILSKFRHINSPSSPAFLNFSTVLWFVKTQN